MLRLSGEVLSLLVPLHPQLRQEWGDLALIWGTTCPIRSIAFRSLQTFRALMPRINRHQLASMIGRISNTISELDEHLQSFTREMLITFTTIAKSGVDQELLPPMFWCTCACLSTAVEQEFLTVLGLLDALLDRLDLNDSHVIDSLLAFRPGNWVGPETNLQTLVMVGLRSSVTCDAAIALIGKLVQVEDPELIDTTGDRVKNLFTALMPWFLNAMDGKMIDGAIATMAIHVSHLAELEGRTSMARLLRSFSKGIIRTRDDFLRQGVSCIREHCSSQDPTAPVTLLLGLVLNSQRWLRIKSMEVLKTLFQHPQGRMPVARSELLTPLLRLLTTDLAPQALEVLDEPLTISGGPSPVHALRMSMHFTAIGASQHKNLSDGVESIFGTPSESGWSIASPEDSVDLCRGNTLAVFDACKPNNRPSVITFEPEARSRLGRPTPPPSLPARQSHLSRRPGVHPQRSQQFLPKR